VRQVKNFPPVRCPLDGALNQRASGVAPYSIVDRACLQSVYFARTIAIYENRDAQQESLKASQSLSNADKALLLRHWLGGGEQVNPELRNLIALQDIEIKITSLQKQVADIPNVIQNFENELRINREEYERRVARSKELANRRRALEGDVDLSRSKLSRLKDQLMAVKTNKEYTAMLHEIQTAEEQIRGEEDKILEIMEEMEDMEKDLKGAEQEMNKKSAELQESIRKANESAPQMEAELEKLRQDRSQVESQISAELLSRYHRIAHARKGIALAEAKDELCSACHVRIRPQMYAELLRTDNIYACDSCSRILFSRESF
jgi:predicted  nucleic acid-binding Zn-ribbon protein